ncbi:MAG: Cof-type HAD-IIB family hydrolase [Chloroflexota bacterium]
MIELVALDVDGTLIDEGMTIPARVREAVIRVQEQGVTATLATGRMLEAALPFARELQISAPLICYQGALIQGPDAEEPLHWATMAPEIVREALAWGGERGWHAVLYAKNALFVSEKRYPESFYRDLLGENLHWVDDLASVLDHRDPVKFLFIAAPREADEIEAAMRQRFAERMEIVRSHGSFVEGNPPGASKGDALQRLANHLGVARDRVMAVGDQGNDVSMLEWAGIGVAMGNASPEAKAAADWIAPPFSEHGAAVALERFILNA